MQSAVVAAGIAIILALWAGWTLTAAWGLDRLADLSARVPAAAAAPPPVRWTKRPAPCFFAGKPEIWTEKACGGSANEARHTFYCEPDPNCLDLPDGTPFARP